MKHRTILTASATLVLLAACNRASEEEVDTNVDVAATNEAGPDAATAPAAADFVSQAAASDLYEIEAGKLAGEKAANPEIKSFGQMLVTDHTRSSDELKASARQSSPPPTPPTALPADKQSKIDALRAASGAEFDRLFLAQQIEAHSAALELLKSYAANGDAEALKAFAAKTAPVVETHLQKARSLQQ